MRGHMNFNWVALLSIPCLCYEFRLFMLWILTSWKYRLTVIINAHELRPLWCYRTSILHHKRWPIGPITISRDSRVALDWIYKSWRWSLAIPSERLQKSLMSEFGIFRNYNPNNNSSFGKLKSNFAQDKKGRLVLSPDKCIALLEKCFYWKTSRITGWNS